MLIDFRPVLVVTGYVLLILAAAMGGPLVVSVAVADGQWRGFLLAIAASGFVGAAMILSGRGRVRGQFHRREAFLAMATGWVLGSLAGSIPFAESGLHLAPVEALFESVSGLTTTGATVITGLESVPESILLWRALLNWLGGIGVVLAAIAVLPLLRIGGMQLFRLESMEPGEGAVPRLSRLARMLLIAYPAFTLLLVIGFAICGMTALEAFCHAMSTISTGGFSTSDRSFGHFTEGARWVAVAGMLVGGTSFSALLDLRRRGREALLGDSQVRRFLLLLVGFSLLLALWNWSNGGMEMGEALRRSIFNTVSVLTTSGFHWGDYDSWGGFAQVAFFLMALMGGCTGSAAGGIKVFRFEILFAAAGIHLRRLLHPHGMFSIELNHRRVPEPVVRSVLGFVMLYLICVAVLAIALAATGIDITASISGAAAAIGNVGPGIGHLIGPGGTYHNISDAGKWLLVGGMLIGRIELATAIVLVTPGFWRH